MKIPDNFFRADETELFLNSGSLQTQDKQRINKRNPQRNITMKLQNTKGKSRTLTALLLLLLELDKLILKFMWLD